MPEVRPLRDRPDNNQTTHERSRDLPISRACRARLVLRSISKVHLPGWTGGHLEALADVRRRHEPKHPLGARAAPWQAGLEVPRPDHPDGAVGSPDVRTGIG